MAKVASISSIINMAFVAGLMGGPTSNISTSQGIGSRNAICGAFFIACTSASRSIVASTTRQVAINYILQLDVIPLGSSMSLVPLQWRSSHYHEVPMSELELYIWM